MLILDIIFYLAITFFSIVLLFFLFWKFWFLRDPRRRIPGGNSIVSPADGKINKIIKGYKKKEYINKGFMGKVNTLASDVSESYYLINIVMTPLDVHVQRSPIKGEVIKKNYLKGKFNNAIRAGIAIENEKNEVLIQGDIRVKVIQIAGFLARRIECFVGLNQKLNKGERIGLINLGSQVSVIVPSEVELSVKEGQRVCAGETIIGRLK